MIVRSVVFGEWFVEELGEKGETDQESATAM